MKDRIYYQNAYKRTFKAHIVGNGKDSNGRPYVVLSNTAFYPTGGGQPHDTGTIEGVQVIDVEEMDGEIRHFLEEELQSKEDVEGEIDWERRFDHMQQHAGQHILTAAFVRLYGFQTVSFHLGRGLVSIDLDVEDVTAEQLDAAEKLANDVILENRPIETKWVTEDELSEYSLRKQLAVTDDIRLVIIPDFDDNGCGGTHPLETGQVGMLKIMSTEKQKRIVRVHFACGGRVLQQLHRKNAELSAASKLLSAPEDGVSDAIDRLLASHHELEKSLKKTKEDLLLLEAKSLLDNKNGTLVRFSFTDRTVQDLQKLARMLVAEDETVIALLVAENENRLQFVAARGVSAGTSMKLVSASALPLLNGKGGGNDALVQGGGAKTMSADELLHVMENSITQQ
ncbi:DHHA1 domain-containing protein [Sporosarcina luteola]|nr:DHHA1 domain-containing protein [Sporosarcina luteola]MCM3744479.1 DHHA1 domain-containing protein [Sporosarcina luteola]